MRILLDECLPAVLREWLALPEVETVPGMGWAGVSNGELLRRAEGQFDVFLTADKRLRYQQNLRGRRIAILVLPSNRLKFVRSMLDEILAAIATFTPSQPGQYLELPNPPF